MSRFRRGVGVLLVLMVVCGIAIDASASWPPRKGQVFPDDITYIDQDGNKLKISRFKGKVLFVEYVGMNCPACQAFSGANSVGPYRNNPVQGGLQSIETYFPRYASGIRLSDPRIVFVQILLYDMNLKAPAPADATAWAEHFGMHTNRQQYVLVPLRDMRSPASFNLIPGFQLIDRRLRVLSDSTGHRPQDDLWRTLLPMVPKLLQ
ncbi:MAG: hypothetical protein K8I00_09040 [Candidatus Omnitrophica bacterium]|nr:hypothetical protein [Candidatus Omnitrophota bacterium]